MVYYERVYIPICDSSYYKWVVFILFYVMTGAKCALTQIKILIHEYSDVIVQTVLSLEWQVDFKI